MADHSWKPVQEDIDKYLSTHRPSNFDRITQSPEALAKMIFGVIKNSEVCQCPAFTLCNGTGGINCEQTLIKWLNQPEEESHGKQSKF